MQRQTEGSMLCPSCHKLISVSTERCPHCGAGRPGLWGFGPGLSRLVGRLDPLSLIVTTCVGLYLVALAINPGAALRPAGGMFGILSPDPVALAILGNTGPADLATGRWWTLLTAIYLHGSALHILFNMLWTRSLAPELVRGFGPARFFLIWSLAGAFGFLLSNLFRSSGFSVGASGSVFGLMAALIVVGRTVGATMMTRQIWMYALILGLFGFMSSRVDNFAHVGGFAGGWALAMLFRSQLGRPEGRGVTVAALAILAVTVGGFVMNVGRALAYFLS